MSPRTQQLQTSQRGQTRADPDHRGGQRASAALQAGMGTGSGVLKSTFKGPPCPCERENKFNSFASRLYVDWVWSEGEEVVAFGASSKQMPLQRGNP